MASTSKGNLSRRALLAGTAGAIGAKLLPAQDPVRDATNDPTKVQGDLTRELGERSRFEEPRRTFFSSSRTASNTPRQDFEGITPADLHFERHRGGIPEIDPDNYSLLIHGRWRDRERSRSRTRSDFRRWR